MKVEIETIDYPFKSEHQEIWNSLRNSGWTPCLRSNDETACRRRAYKSAPGFYPKYGASVEAFLLQRESQYGHDKVKTWNFEVWNEPNLMVRKVRGTIRKHPAYKGLEFLFYEISTPYDPHDPMRDVYQSTSYLHKVLKKTEAVVTIVGYWAFNDIIEEIGSVFSGVCFDGWGSMDPHGLKKPADFAYNYIHGQGATEMSNADANTRACKSGNDVQIHFLDDNLLDQKSQPIRTFDGKLHHSEFMEQAALQIFILKNGTHTLQWFRTGYQANDYHTACVNLASPSKLTVVRMQLLADACRNAPVNTKTVHVTHRRSGLAAEFLENDAHLLMKMYTA